ncbi:MAG: leucine-rich repeat domain-containing protein [Saprospiraceae bacterium]
MIKALTITAIVLLPLCSFSQICKDYSCAIQKVYQAIQTENYRAAFEYLESADAYPEKDKLEVRTLRKQIFDAIDEQRNTALLAEANAKKALSVAKAAEKVQEKIVEPNLPSFASSGYQLKGMDDEEIMAYAQSAYRTNQLQQKADALENQLLQLQTEQYKTTSTLSQIDSINQVQNRLTDAYYFYDDKFALAYKNGKFGFIDKQGNEIIDYQFDVAEQFDELGYAAVKIKIQNQNLDYLLDTTGTYYKVVHQSSKLNESTSAFYPSSGSFDVFPSNLTMYNQLNVIIFHENNIRSIPSDIQNFTDLEILSLTNCNVETVTYEVGSLKQLKRLLLRNHRLRIIPSSIGQLKNLNLLDLSGLRDNANVGLEYIPDEIGKLKKLTWLDLQHNQLSELPSSLGRLYNLKYLNVSNNQLSSLPTSFMDLESLELLNVSHNPDLTLENVIQTFKNYEKPLFISSKRLPKNGQPQYLSIQIPKQLDALTTEIRGLKKVKSLELEGNFYDKKGLKTLPSTIGELKELQYLNLNYNQLEILPDEIGRLKKLNYLAIKRNKLSYLPLTFGQLKSIQKLELTDNLLTTLPLTFGELESLENLDLSNNLLLKLPPTFGNLNEIRILNLANNQLIDLPHNFRYLENLELLDLRNNVLKSLPESWQQPNLIRLYVMDNNLHTLPKNINNSINLTTINASNNAITILPFEIGQLPNLENLILKKNQLTTLPMSISFLKNLKNLNLSNNKFVTLPREIGLIQNLLQLDLSNNQLTKLPMSIGRLTNLKSLNLSNNHLERLPFELRNLKQLEYLYIFNNQFSEDEKEVIRKLLPDCKIYF